MKKLKFLLSIPVLAPAVVSVACGSSSKTKIFTDVSYDWANEHALQTYQDYLNGGDVVVKKPAAETTSRTSTEIWRASDDSLADSLSLTKLTPQPSPSVATNVLFKYNTHSVEFYLGEMYTEWAKKNGNISFYTHSSVWPTGTEPVKVVPGATSLEQAAAKLLSVPTSYDGYKYISAYNNPSIIYKTAISSGGSEASKFTYIERPSPKLWIDIERKNHFKPFIVEPSSLSLIESVKYNFPSIDISYEIKGYSGSGR